MIYVVRRITVSITVDGCVEIPIVNHVLKVKGRVSRHIGTENNHIAFGRILITHAQVSRRFDIVHRYWNLHRSTLTIVIHRVEYQHRRCGLSIWPRPYEDGAFQVAVIVCLTFSIGVFFGVEIEAIL